MTSKRFLFGVGGVVVVTLLAIVSTNYYLNLFGLFRSESSLRIWVDEKTSKYLMSFRYVPENFEGAIIGPSVSTNMQTKNIEGFKIYNLSMNGGNISEIKYAIDNVLEKGNLKYLVVCVYPYLTKNSGIKGRQINKKEYWGSLYSLIPMRVAMAATAYQVFPRLDQFHDSEWGYNDSNLSKKHIVFENIISRKIENHPKEIVVDPQAYNELREVLDLARLKGVQIFAYYYPIYYEFIDVYRASGAWDWYQEEMNGLFTKDDLLWDMNEPDYDYLTHNTRTYIDGHLSDWGAEQVVEVIETKLKSFESSRRITEIRAAE